MGVSAFKIVVLALFIVDVTAKESEDSPHDPSDIEAGSYGSSSFGSTDSRSSDMSPEEPSPPPPSSALASVGPLLSLLQPVIGGILNGPGSETENGATYPPLLKPLFTPLTILPGFGVIPSSLAAQTSDFLATAAASARTRFAQVARENAARSQVNYGHILSALNELNMPIDAEES